MDKISFTAKSLVDGSEILGPVANDDKYILLSYFLGDCSSSVSEVIGRLESIVKEEKTFEEIMEDYADWTFGNGEGEFTCDGDTAYFESIGSSQYPDIEMPLSELIEMLKKWRDHLRK